MNHREEVPQGLKPSSVQSGCGTAEAVPFVQGPLPQSVKSGHSKRWLAFAALGVIWGTSWIAAETLAEYVSPLRGAAARFLLAAVLCIPVVLWKRVRLPRGRALGFVLLLSVTMIVFPFVLLLWAQLHVPSATVVVLFAAMPLLLALSTPGVPSRALQATIVAVGAIALAVGASFSAAQAGGAAVALLAVASTAASLLIGHRRRAAFSCELGSRARTSAAMEPQCNRFLDLSGSCGGRPGLCLLLLAPSAARGVSSRHRAMDRALGSYCRERVIPPLGLVVQHGRRFSGYLDEFATSGARPDRR
jgi:hypothetical protein